MEQEQPTTTTTTTTELYVYTSAPAAIRSACRHGWTRLEVDTSSWSEDERNTLAASVRDFEGRVIVGAGYAMHQAESVVQLLVQPPGTRLSVVDVAPPTVERLREIVVGAAMAMAVRRAEEAQRAKEREAAEAAERRRLSESALEDLLVLQYTRGSNQQWCVRHGADALRPDAVEEARKRNADLREVVARELVECGAAKRISGAKVSDWAHVIVDHHGRKVEASVHYTEWPDGLHAQARAELARVEAEREAEVRGWIGEHGSPRLRRCLAEELELGAILRDEWLAHTYPGWQWYDDVEWSFDEPRSPTDEAFAVLDRGRAQVPSAELGYWRDGNTWGWCVSALLRVPGGTKTRMAVLTGETHMDEDEEEEGEDY